MEEESLKGPEYDQPGRDVIIIFAVFFEAGLAPFSIFLGWMLGYPPLAQFVWSLRDARSGAIAAVPVIVLFLLMLNWPIGPLARVKRFCDEEVVPLFAQTHWSELALISISAGVGEEMLFRGVFQAALTHWFGTGWGLALSSVLFGLLHPISITYIVIAGVLGAYLGAVWLWNGNLLAVMVTHALYDFAVLGYLIRLQKRGKHEADLE
jgi:membrane protease YdiL (CAAX protease family)